MGRRKRGEEPQMRFHSHSGQARVRINGKVIYLRPWDSTEAKEKYHRLADRPGGSQQGSLATIGQFYGRFMSSDDPLMPDQMPLSVEAAGPPIRRRLKLCGLVPQPLHGIRPNRPLVALFCDDVAVFTHDTKHTFKPCSFVWFRRVVVPECAILYGNKKSSDQWPVIDFGSRPQRIVHQGPKFEADLVCVDNFLGPWRNIGSFCQSLQAAAKLLLISTTARHRPQFLQGGVKLSR